MPSNLTMGKTCLSERLCYCGIPKTDIICYDFVKTFVPDHKVNISTKRNINCPDNENVHQGQWKICAQIYI